MECKACGYKKATEEWGHKPTKSKYGDYVILNQEEVDADYYKADFEKVGIKVASGELVYCPECKIVQVL